MNSISQTSLWPVEIDEGQIHQVVNNLVINAVQAMPEGGTLEVRAVNMVVSKTQGLPLGAGRYVKISLLMTDRVFPGAYE